MAAGGASDDLDQEVAGGCGFGRPDYQDVFSVQARGAGSRSAEQWMRAVFEEAPLPMRWFLVLGWRAVLGLRLGPLSSPEHMLGWRLTASQRAVVRAEAQSALMRAELALRVEETAVVLTTSGVYTRRPARLLWTVVRPIHRRLAPYLLARGLSSRDRVVMRHRAAP